jgi:predicted lipase
MKLNKKNKLLLVGLVLVLIACYRFAFFQTFTYRNVYIKQVTELRENSDMSVQLSMLKRKFEELEQQINQFSNIDTLSFQNELLKNISRFADKKGLTIKEFKEPHVTKSKGIKITSYKFMLEGGFNPTLQLINDLENNTRLGFVKHIYFQKKMNYKNNIPYLTTEIILQRNELESNTTN